MQVDFSKHFRPTAENHGNHVTKAACLSVARDVLGDEWVAAQDLTKMKKADIAASLEAVFAPDSNAPAAAQEWTIPEFLPKAAGRPPLHQGSQCCHGIGFSAPPPPFTQLSSAPPGMKTRAFRIFSPLTAHANLLLPTCPDSPLRILPLPFYRNPPPLFG